SNSGSSYREILVTCMVIAKESINLLSNSIEPDLGQAARRGFLPRRAVLRSPPPTHNGSSVNFLGDGTIFWGDGTAVRGIKAAEAMNMASEQFVNMVLTPRGSLAKAA